MDEQQVLAAYQQMIRTGTPPSQAAQQLARLYPQHARALQGAAGGQPGNPVQGAVTPQAEPHALGTGPVSPGQNPPVAPAGQGVASGPGPATPAVGPSPQKPPGYYQAGAAGPQDKYGGGMRANTNAAGVQSNGDDDPWLIGAARGTTYDPETMLRWHQRAQAGDGKAAYVLRQVGFYDEQNRPAFQGPDGLEQWANSRSLDRRAAQGAATPWYHDPKNWGGSQGFTGAEDADTAFKATPWAQGATPNDHPSSYPGARSQPQAEPHALGTGPSSPSYQPPTGPTPNKDPQLPDIETGTRNAATMLGNALGGKQRFDGPDSGFNPNDWEVDPNDPNHATRKKKDRFEDDVQGATQSWA